MKRILALILSTVFIAQTVYADTCSVGLGNAFPPSQANALCKVGTGMVPQAPGDDNTISAGTVSKRLSNVWTAGSISVDTFQGLYAPPNTVTVASTPVADVNMCDGLVNLVTSASANNACILNDATGVGKWLTIVINVSGQTIRAKGGAGATMNASSVAGAYTSISDGAGIICYRSAALKNYCWNITLSTVSASP